MPLRPTRLALLGLAATLSERAGRAAAGATPTTAATTGTTREAARGRSTGGAAGTLEAAAGSALAAAGGTAGNATAHTTENAAGTKAAPPLIDLATAEQAVDTAALRYDRDGDQHYDVISAFIKSIRGSDVDAALHYLARMLEAGEDARFIARRMIIFASEDVGQADPTALLVAVAAAHALEHVGLPEAQLNLSQAAIHLATAPKSNRSALAIWNARDDVRNGAVGEVVAADTTPGIARTSVRTSAQNCAPRSGV